MNTAAAATQSGSNLTLYVAIIGILGTLTAAFMTQWLSSKRDDKQWERQKQLQDERFDREREQEDARWQRDREQDEVRWGREREERREQWQREDAARLHQDRLQAYNSLLTESQDIARHVSYLSTFTVALENEPNDQNIVRVRKQAERIQDRVSAISGLVQRIRLIGSAKVNELVTQLADSAFLAAGSSAGVPDHSMSDDMRRHVDDVGKAASDLHREIRRDVGSGEIADDFDDKPPF